MFSPLPPARSGVADYVSDLLSVLPSSWTVDVFGADEPGSDASGQLASEHARAGEKGPIAVAMRIASGRDCTLSDRMI